MAKVRIMTDGAGQEIIAELENSVKTLNGEEVNDINPEDYGSKNMVLEDTGRSIAENIGNVNDALCSYMEGAKSKDDSLQNSIDTLNEYLGQYRSATSDEIKALFEDTDDGTEEEPEDNTDDSTEDDTNGGVDNGTDGDDTDNTEEDTDSTDGTEENNTDNGEDDNTDTEVDEEGAGD